MRDAALALLQDTFENPARDPRDRLLLAAGPGAAIELPESVQRSWDFGHGFAEGNGFSILQSLEALNAVVRDPGQLLSGLQALITSAEARGQLGQDILNGIRNDMQMFRDAYAAGDMRRAGQQFGKLTGDLVQLVGGVEAVARLAPGLARGAGRGASAVVVDRLTDPRLASPVPGSRRAQLGGINTGRGNQAPASLGEAALNAAANRPPNTTRLGIPRRNAADWRDLLRFWDELGYSEIISPANRQAIARGRTPRVDDAWIAAFPEDAGLAGERITMHHIGGGLVTIPLPTTRHINTHMPGGFRRNPGGPGAAVPFYRKAMP